MNLFTKSCASCGGFVFGPREGGKARGRWLGYDECLDCREAKSADAARSANPTERDFSIHAEGKMQSDSRGVKR